MRLIIDIPKIAYENTKRFGKLSTINDDELAKAIRKGTPLPASELTIIDAIRKEIERKHDRAIALNMVLQMNAYTDCLQIIDKYKDGR